MLNHKDQDLLRFSLVFVWLATALTSVWELHGQSLQLLSGIHSNSPGMGNALILGGAGIDALLGLAMWFWPCRRTYLVTLVFMLLMTMVATLIDTTWWLHPLGPLTKNIPIAAVLFVLGRKSS